jgi:glycosyltransferase involved in cell wall biosynthesis
MVSTPRNYMSGVVPDRYRHRLFAHEAIDGVDHHWVWSPGGIHRSRSRRVANYVGFAAAAAARAATLPRPSVVFVSSPPLTVAPLGPLLARRFRRPWILEVRDIWPESAVSVGWLRRESSVYDLLERLSRRVTTAADSVVIPTPGLEPFVKAHGARTVVTLTGAAVPRTFDPARRAAARRRFAIRDDECVFVYVGALGVANSVNELLGAVRQVPADTPFRILVAGAGSAREAVERELENDRTLERVTLLPPVPIDEVDDLLAAADVGLHLLRPDPVFVSALPSKILDYLGAGLPFITTVPGLPAQIAADSSGSSVASSDELARELQRWAETSPAERKRRGEQAFAYGQEQFGFETGVARLEALLTEVAASSERRR